MASYGGHPPTYQATTTPTGQPGNTAMPYRGCVSKAFKVTGILHIIAGGLCVVLGITAAASTAVFSYIAMPIWGGLLFFIATGIIGLVHYCKPRRPGLVMAYMVMSIISAAFAGVMCFTYIGFVSDEAWRHDYESCNPDGNYDYDYDYCNGPQWLRMLADSLLVIIFGLETGCGATAAGMACFKTCRCCRTCCRSCCSEGQTQPNVMYYPANGGNIPMIAVPANQTSRPIYIAGGPSGNRGGPVMIVASSPQSQPMQGQAQVPQVQGHPPQVQAQPVQIQTQPGQVQMQPAQYQAQSFVQVQGQHFIQAPVQAQASSCPAQAQGGMVIAAAASPVYPTPTLAPGSQPPTQQQPPQQGPPQQGSNQQGPPQDQTKQDKAQEATETMEVVSGQNFSGQFSDQSALI